MYQGLGHPCGGVPRFGTSLLRKFFQSWHNVIITTLPQERGLVHPLSLPLGHIPRGLCPLGMCPRGRLAGMSQTPYPSGGVVIISHCHCHDNPASPRESTLGNRCCTFLSFLSYYELPWWAGPGCLLCRMQRRYFYFLWTLFLWSSKFDFVAKELEHST